MEIMKMEMDAQEIVKYNHNTLALEVLLNQGIHALYKDLIKLKLNRSVRSEDPQV